MLEKDCIKIAEEIKLQAEGNESQFLIEKEATEIMTNILDFFQKQVLRRSYVIKENKKVYEVNLVYGGTEYLILYCSSHYPKWLFKKDFYSALKKVEEAFNSLEGYDAKGYFKCGEYHLDITLKLSMEK